MAETPAGMLLREREEARALLVGGCAQDWSDQAEPDRRLVESSGSPKSIGS